MTPPSRKKRRKAAKRAIAVALRERPIGNHERILRQYLSANRRTCRQRGAYNRMIRDFIKWWVMVDQEVAEKWSGYSAEAWGVAARYRHPISTHLAAWLAIQPPGKVEVEVRRAIQWRNSRHPRPAWTNLILRICYRYLPAGERSAFYDYSLSLFMP